MKRLFLFVVLVIGCAAPPALAHFDTGHYTHDDCPVVDNSTRVDPINFIFRDWGTIDRAINTLEYHADWTDEEGTSQAFVDHGDCYEMAGQRSDAIVLSSRNHIRLHPIHQDTGVGWTTVGDAHFEDTVGCDVSGPPFYKPSHAVRENGPSGSGYDMARNDLFYWFDLEPGHSGHFSWWGTRRTCSSAMRSTPVLMGTLCG